MTSKISIRTAAIAWLVGSACASQTRDGTDSNTHWVTCTTVLDCPNASDFQCVGGRCVTGTSIAARVAR